MTQQNSNIWKTVGITTFVILSLFFTYFVFNNSNTYKKEINVLKHELDSLNKILENRVDKDSILYYIDEQRAMDFAINKLNIKIDSINRTKYEKKIDYSILSLDSNVVILSRNLSSEDSD